MMHSTIVSKKSQSFILWLRNRLGVVANNGLVEKLVELELAARLISHSVDRIGEPDPKDLHALIRASKNLEAEYGQK